MIGKHIESKGGFEEAITTLITSIVYKDHICTYWGIFIDKLASMILVF